MRSFEKVAEKMEVRLLRYAFLRWGKEMLRKHSVILGWTKYEVVLEIKKYKANKRDI